MEDALKAALALAAWHVANAKETVAQQLAIVKSLHEGGCPVVVAEETLKIFIQSLQAFEDSESLLREEIKLQDKFQWKRGF